MQTNNRIAKQTDTTVIPFRPAFIPEGGFSEENPPDYSDGTNYVTPRWLYLQELFNGNQLKIDSQLYTVGRNGAGELGLGDINTRYSFTKVSAITDPIKKITMGADHSFILKEDGTLWASGMNIDGQLGLGYHYGTHNVFEQTGGNTNDWMDVSAGGINTAALKKDGTLWICGDNSKGQLGIGTNPTDSPGFVQVGTDTNWSQISVGGASILALKIDGSLWACGNNYGMKVTDGSNGYGFIGLGGVKQQNTIIQVGTDTDWEKICCGINSSSAIKRDGTLYTTGINEYGALGLGDYTDRAYFTKVGTDSDWKEISAGYNAFLAIKKNGTLWSTGYNNVGQLGLGDKVNRNIFTQVGTDTNWVNVSAGYIFSLALKQDQSLYGCGDNFYGQSGVGGVIFTKIPLNGFILAFSAGKNAESMILLSK